MIKILGFIVFLFAVVYSSSWMKISVDKLPNNVKNTGVDGLKNELGIEDSNYKLSNARYQIMAGFTFKFYVIFTEKPDITSDVIVWLMPNGFIRYMGSSRVNYNKIMFYNRNLQCSTEWEWCNIGSMICCPGFNCNRENKCCISDNNSCQYHNQCCTKSCVNNKCGCLKFGNRCNEHLECCSKRCVKYGSMPKSCW